MKYTEKQIKEALIEMDRSGLIRRKLEVGDIVMITPKGKRVLRNYRIKQKIKNFFFPRSEV